MDFDAGDIVISVKAEYLAMIMNGEKTIELRRKTVKVSPGSRIWLYETSPTAHIAAYALVEKVITGTPKKIWSDYRNDVGITLAEFDSYFEGSSLACAIVLSEVRQVVPALKLSELRTRLNGFHPPQFFKRLRQNSPELRLLRAHIA